MPTTSIASADSRQTMKSALPMVWSVRALLGDELALAGVLVEFVDELVFAGLERADRQRRLAAGRNDFLLLELLAFEFHRRLAGVGHFELQTLAGGHFDHRGREDAVVRDELEESRVFGEHRDCQLQREGGGDDARQRKQRVLAHGRIQVPGSSRLGATPFWQLPNGA